MVPSMWQRRGLLTVHFSTKGLYVSAWEIIELCKAKMVEVQLAIVGQKLTALDLLLEGQPPNVAGMRGVNETIRDMTRHAIGQLHRRNDGDPDTEFGTWENRLEALLYSLEDWVDEFEYLTNSTREPTNINNGSCPGLFVFGLYPRQNQKLLRRLSKIDSELQGLQERMNEFNLQVRSSEDGNSNSRCSDMPTDDDIQVQKTEVERLKTLLLQQDDLIIFIRGEVDSGRGRVVSKACHQVEVKRNFDYIAWVRLYGSTALDILISIWKSCCQYKLKIKKENTDEERLISNQIRDYLHQQERYLLVLEGLEDNDELIVNAIRKFQPPDGGGRGRVVVITSMQNHLEENDISNIQIESLSRDDALVLFRAKALQLDLSSRSFEISNSIVEHIVERCSGSYLGISIIGGMLSTKENPNTREQFINMFPVDDHPITAHDQFLRMGYWDLPPLLKVCFLYTCLIFPEYHLEISKREVIRLWLAEGFVVAEETAEQLFEQLIQRNMLERARLGDTHDVEACKVLKPMRSFAVLISSTLNFCSILSSNGDNNSHANSSCLEDILRVLVTDSETSCIRNGRFLKLRSLLIWESKKELNMGNGRNFLFCRPRFKLLRVLIMQGSSIKKVCGNGLGGLLLLRYLGLRDTEIIDLPVSLRRLQKLQTIDVRDTKMTCLPQNVSLHKVRHLLLAKSCSETAVEVPLGFLSGSTEVRTLAGLRMNEDWARDVRCHTELRKLSVSEVRTEHSNDLCTSINNMTHLRSLTIKCCPDQQFSIQSLNKIPSLVKLRLGGSIDHLLEKVRNFDSLVSLFLWNSNLTEDPVSAFSHLPNLVRLVLKAAYVGDEIGRIDEGFDNLRHLSIIDFTNLERWQRIGKRAMQKLQTLVLGSCQKLKMLPEGLENLGQLQVFVQNMNSDNATFKERCGLIVHSVQDTVDV